MLVFGVYLYLSSPGEVVIDQQGQIAGPMNKVRAQLQGPSFWRDQLLEAKRALESRRAAPERDKKRQARLEASLEKSKQRMEEFYKQHPKTRPSEATERAEALRERADEIEQEELDEYLEKRRLDKISNLEAIIRFIEARAS